MTTITMRALTPDEAQVIRWFAARAGESARRTLLEDLEDTMVEEIRDEHVTLRFRRWGHPPESFIIRTSGRPRLLRILTERISL